MFRIMLCRLAGMPASLLIRKMVEETESCGLSAKIEIYGVSESDTQLPNYWAMLLGPRVRYMLNTPSGKAIVQDIPVEIMGMADHGMQRGDKVLDYALSLIEATH